MAGSGHAPAARKAGPSDRIALLLVLTAALASQAWVLGLPFRQDDFVLIASAREWLAGSASPRGATDDPSPEAGRAPFTGMYRPVFWAVIAATRRAGGETPDPVTFEAVALGLHALASLAVFALARAWLPPRTAWIPAVLFAVHPAGAQAFAWIAAGGDLLGTLFMTLAVAVAWKCRAGAPAGSLAAGLLTALAMGSKESGFAVIPIVLAVAVFRSPGPRWRDVLAVLGPVAAFVVLRRFVLGSWWPTYHSTSAGSAEAVLTRISDPRSWLGFAGHAFLPWDLSPDSGSVRPLAARLALGCGMDAASAQRWLGAIVAGILVLPLLRSRKGILAVAGAGLAFAIVAAPAMTLWLPGAGPAQSRNFHAPLVPWCLMAGGGAAALWNVGRKRTVLRAAARLGVLAAAALTADAWVHTVRYQRRAGEWIESSVRDVAALVDARPGGTLVIEEPGTKCAGQYLIGPSWPDRFAPPFHPRRPDLVVFRSLPGPVLEEILAWDSRPLAFCRRDGARVVAVGRAIPPFPTVLPECRSGGGDGIFVPAIRIPVRSVYAFDVGLPDGPALRLAADIEAGTRAWSRSAEVAASEGPRRAQLRLEPGLDELQDPSLDRIRLTVAGAGGPVPFAGGVTLVARPARAAALAPASGATVPWDRIRFVVAAGGRRCRASVVFVVAVDEFMARLSFEWDPAAVTLDSGGSAVLDPASASPVSGSPDWGEVTSWVASRPEIGRRIPMTVSWRATLSDPVSGGAAFAETGWGFFMLGP